MICCLSSVDKKWGVIRFNGPLFGWFTIFVDNPVLASTVGDFLFPHLRKIDLVFWCVYACVRVCLCRYMYGI